MPIGCCGNTQPVSLQGLLADADFYPARSPQGQRARARLAYGIAAGKAAQQGNMPAYRRALEGLRGGLGTAPTSADALAAGQGLQRLVGTLSGSAAFRAQLAQASSYINIVLSAAQIGTGIASSACSGCDRTGIDAVNLIISLVRTLISGGTPTVPTMSVDTLNGFVSFCQVKDVVKGGVDTAFGIASVAASAANNAGAASALNAVQGFVDNLLDGICSIPQVQMAVAGAAAPPANTAVPATKTGVCGSNGAGYTQTWDPVTQMWGAATPPCPISPAASGLEVGAGGCISGQFNVIAPGGVLNPATGAAIPGTVGGKSCATCRAPSIYIPGVTNAAGFWASTPGCMNSAGEIFAGPGIVSGPCPTGTTRGTDGKCRGAVPGSSSSGSSVAIPLAAGAAFLAWKFLF